MDVGFEEAGEDDSAAFFSRWPYRTPSDILPYIQAHAAPGDAQAVLDAMDTFASHYPMYRVGRECTTPRSAAPAGGKTAGQSGEPARHYRAD